MVSPNGNGIALIVGLGNPGNQYAATRHNAGFRFVNLLQASLDFRLVSEKRFKAEVGSVTLNGCMVRVITPTTMMNLSGQAVAAVASFYRIQPEQILIIHDELDLAAGVARLKLSGGHGGHNGLRDIITSLGSSDFARLRIGIGHPGAQRDVVGYVLCKPDAHGKACIEQAMAHALEVMDDIIAGNIPAAMRKLHSETPT